METKIKRPTSIWVAQTLLFVFAMVFAAPVVVIVMTLFGPNRAAIPVANFALVAAVSIVLFCLFAVAFWGMSMRRTYGRWLGFAMLLLSFIFMVIGQFARPDGPMQYYEYENQTQAMSGFLTQVLMAALFLLLLYYIAFGKRVAAFFAQTTEPSVSDDVPPPPTFDA